MGYPQFPSQFWIKTLNPSVSERLAKFVPDRDMFLRYLVLTFLKSGTSTGAETMQLKVYSSWDLSKPALFSSDVRPISDIEIENSDSWLGRLRFDFDDPSIEADAEYFLVMEVSNYARTSSYYLACVLDWPDRIYSQVRSVAGVQMRVIGLCERSNDMAVGGEVRLVEVAAGTVITAPSDMTVPASTFAAAIRINALAGGPIEDELFSVRVFRFSKANAGSELAVGFLKIPQDYVAGTPISLYVAIASVSTSNTILLSATSYLITKDTTALDSTTNSRASTNTALTNATTSYKYRQATIDITDVNGQVNGVAVAAGDTLRIAFARGSDSDTADLIMIPELTEVQYNG